MQNYMIALDHNGALRLKFNFHDNDNPDVEFGKKIGLVMQIIKYNHKDKDVVCYKQVDQFEVASDYVDDNGINWMEVERI